MYINISYKFQRIPDSQSCFLAQVRDLLGQASYVFYLKSEMDNIYIS